MFLDRLRFLAALLCLLVALPVLFKVTWLPLWFVQVGATEYGHWWAIAPLALVFVGTRRPLSIVATLLALAAVAIFLSTIFRAQFLAQSLPNELAIAFGESQPNESPISWRQLWFGSRGQAIAPESLVYHTQPDYTLHLEFYRSAPSAPAPCVVVIHTGGWDNGTPHEFIAMNSHLAHRGYAVAALEYRLAPRWKWPAQREDVRNALTFLKQNATRLGLNPSKFILLGRSAGGHIAETCAYSLHDPAVRGCIAFYAPADMNFAYRYSDENDILHSPKLLRDFLGGTPQEATANYNDASAIQFVRPESPPTLLLHGEPDPLVWFRQSERLAAALDAARVRHLLVRLPWATHAFDYNFNGPGGQLSTYAVDYFLDALTR